LDWLILMDYCIYQGSFGGDVKVLL
jgi:hypothetical protein